MTASAQQSLRATDIECVTKRMPHHIYVGGAPLYDASCAVNFNRCGRDDILALTQRWLLASAAGHYCVEGCRILFDSEDDALLCQMKFS